MSKRARIGSGYFLGFFVVAIVLLLWLRGFGRLLVPVLLIGGVLYAIHRVIKKIREPVD